MSPKSGIVLFTSFKSPYLYAKIHLNLLNIVFGNTHVYLYEYIVAQTCNIIVYNCKLIVKFFVSNYGELCR